MIIKDIIKNTSFLTFSRVVSLISSFLFSIFAARLLNPIGYGQYALILVFYNYSLVVADFGSNEIVIREIASKASEEQNIFIDSVNLRSISSFVSAALMILIIGFFKSEILFASLIAAVSLIPGTFYNLQSSILRAKEKMNYIAYTEIIHTVLRTTGGIIAVYLTGSITVLFLWILTADTLRLIIISFFNKPSLKKLTFYYINLFEKRIFKESYSVFGWKVTGSIYGTINVLLLSFVMGDKVTGLFKVSDNIVQIFLGFSTVVVNAIFPYMVKFHSQAAKNGHKAINILFRVLFIFFFPLMIAIYFSGNNLIHLLYGNRYYESGDLLKVLFVQFGLGSALVILGSYGITIGKQKAGMITAVIATVFKFIVCLVFAQTNNLMNYIYGILLADIFNLILLIYAFTYRNKVLKKEMLSIAAIVIFGIIGISPIFIFDGAWGICLSSMYILGFVISNIINIKTKLSIKVS